MRSPDRRLPLAAVMVGALAVAGLAATDFELPAPIDWDRLRAERFDLRWRLPERRSPDMVAEMRRTLDRGIPEWTPFEDRPPVRGVGDLIAEFGRLRGRPAERAALWRRFRKERPGAFRDVEDALPGLLWDDLLRKDAWDPDEDAADDGIAFGLPFSLAGRTEWPWRDLDGSRDVYQASALIWADLDAIKEAENDYAAYPTHAGSRYEFIHAVPRTYVRGTAPDGTRFSSLRIAFRCDLPFPYSTYDCDLRILNRLNADGNLVTDIYSTSRDFYWLAGQDVFLPVRRSDGTWVATLLVRLFGFDLRGVPDGKGARSASLRSSLGNLKRRSEALFEGAGRRPRTVDGAVPLFPLRGVKNTAGRSR